MGGLDFQKELKKTKNKVPIIFITGHGDIPMTVGAMKAGAIDFLTKPLREQDVLDASRPRLTGRMRISCTITRYRICRDVSTRLVIGSAKS